MTFISSCMYIRVYIFHIFYIQMGEGLRCFCELRCLGIFILRTTVNITLKVAAPPLWHQQWHSLMHSLLHRPSPTASTGQMKQWHLIGAIPSCVDPNCNSCDRAAHLHLDLDSPGFSFAVLLCIKYVTIHLIFVLLSSRALHFLFKCLFP